MNNSVETKDVGTMYNIGGEELVLSKDEYEHLIDIIDITDADWKEKLLNDHKYSTVVDALFTTHKIEDAWNIISEYKENIDFKYIFNLDTEHPCPYFQLDRNATDVYKYIYENNIIDDASYAYFQILSGKLSDLDFWSKYLAGKTITERFMTLHDAYNGMNPFDIGLIVLSDDAKDMIFDGIDDDDVKLDEFIIGNYPAVFFDSETIVYLMSIGKLSHNNFSKYFNILFKMYEIDQPETLSANMEKLWTLVDAANVDILDIDLSTIPILDSYINHISQDIDIDLLSSVLINSIAFMNYPYRYINLIKENTGIELNNISAAELKPEKYPYILSYKLLDIVDTSMYKIKYPFPAISSIIYNVDKKIIYKDGIIEYSELAESNIAKQLVELIDAYKNNITDDELMKKCSSDEEYYDLMQSYSSFLS